MVEPETTLKKRRTTAATPRHASRIFSPFRTVGNVSNDVPFAVGTLGSTFYIATSVGRSFQIYDANTLHLLFVSKQQAPAKINHLHAHFHYVYAAFANQIGIYKRGALEHVISCDTSKNVSKVLTFGDYLVAATPDEVFVYKKLTGSKIATEFYTSFKTNALDGDVVDVVHPPTYLNKIVVATAASVSIYNVKTAKLVYTADAPFPAKITAIEPAPALDVVAIGFADGAFCLFHLKRGKILRTVSTGAAGAAGARVTSLSFRTDGAPHMVASLASGDLFFYDLHRRARLHVLKAAHKESHGGVSRAQFLNGQPVVVTNGADNQLKEFCFDPPLAASNTSVVSPPRHLRSRGGHAAPPREIVFADDRAHFVLSASKDRTFWKFSLRKDAQSAELSQRAAKQAPGSGAAPGHAPGRTAGPTLREKFPEIVCVAHSTAREGEWENVATGHAEEPFARTWDSKNGRVGRWQLATIDGGVVKSVCVTECGNFCLVGSARGGIGVYNLQSGIHRKRYQLHKKAVTGIAVDGMNRKMVSCGLDGVVGFYDFGRSRFLGKLQLEAPVTRMVYHKASDLAALALDDLSVVVVDAVTQKVIRVLYGHSNRITGMDFTPDGRWLVTAALDSTMRTWDLPTGSCIDGVRVPSVITDLKIAPTGDVLATTHVNDNGISLWTNRAQFRAVGSRQVEEHEFADAVLPNVSGDGGSSVLDGALDGSVDVDDAASSMGQYSTVDQIDTSLVTLSLQPRNKFNTLVHMDAIKARNRPKEAPKKPEQAPFFLALGGEAVGDRAVEAERGAPVAGTRPDADAPETGAAQSRLSSLRSDAAAFSFESEFTKALRNGAEADDYTEFVEFLVASPASSIDLEIRSLQSTPPYGELVSFVRALVSALERKTNFELVQAFMNMFLKAHGDVIYQLKANDDLARDDVEETGAEALLSVLEQWDALNGEAESRLDDLVKYCSGVVRFLTTV